MYNIKTNCKGRGLLFAYNPHCQFRHDSMAWYTIGKGEYKPFKNWQVSITHGYHHKLFKL